MALAAIEEIWKVFSCRQSWQDHHRRVPAPNPELGELMKTISAVVVLAGLAFATPSYAQIQAASLIGNYVVTGTETDGKSYDGPGPLVITMDKNGSLELKWDGGKYVGIGQVVGNTLAIATNAESRVVIMLMEVKPDGSLEGKYWRRTDAGTKGTEVWKKK
jgi:hypothetical protein